MPRANRATAQHLVRDDRGRLAFHGQLTHLPRLYERTNDAPGGVSDEDRARRGTLLHAGRDVRRVSDGRVVQKHVLADMTDDDRSRAETDAELAPESGRGFEPGAVRGERVSHLQSAAHGLDGGVLDRNRGAEQSHDPVSAELTHGPTVPLDRFDHQRGAILNEPVRGLVSRLLRERGGANRVGEQDGHCSPLCRRVVPLVAGRWGPALRAEASAGRQVQPTPAALTHVMRERTTDGDGPLGRRVLVGATSQHLTERELAIGRGFAGQAERALGDDVALDLVGAAVDRRRRREDHGLRRTDAVARCRRRRRAGRAGAEDVDAEARRPASRSGSGVSLPMLATAWPPPRSASALPRCAFHSPISTVGVEPGQLLADHRIVGCALPPGPAATTSA